VSCTSEFCAQVLKVIEVYCDTGVKDE